MDEGPNCSTTSCEPTASASALVSRTRHADRWHPSKEPSCTVLPSVPSSLSPSAAVTSMTVSRTSGMVGLPDPHRDPNDLACRPTNSTAPLPPTRTASRYRCGSAPASPAFRTAPPGSPAPLPALAADAPRMPADSGCSRRSRSTPESTTVHPRCGTAPCNRSSKPRWSAAGPTTDPIPCQPAARAAAASPNPAAVAPRASDPPAHSALLAGIAPSNPLLARLPADLVGPAKPGNVRGETGERPDLERLHSALREPPPLGPTIKPSVTLSIRSHGFRHASRPINPDPHRARPQPPEALAGRIFAFPYPNSHLPSCRKRLARNHSRDQVLNAIPGFRGGSHNLSHRSPVLRCQLATCSVLKQQAR